MIDNNKGLASKLKRAWSVFKEDNQDSSYEVSNPSSYSSPYINDRMFIMSTKSIISKIYNRISVDVASVDILHATVDENNNMTSVIHSNLNDCLTVEANLDQTSDNLIQDIVITMFEEGHVVVVPTVVSSSKNNITPDDIYELRTGVVTQWYPDAVRVKVYNPEKMEKEEILLPKKFVSIIYNPFIEIMNNNNSTIKRLHSKMAMLDKADSQLVSDKLNMIIQLPYSIKNEFQQKQADLRRKSITDQLQKSEFGIAYIDSTEKITQLSKPLENTLQAQIEFLTKQFQSEMGITEGILDGTADEKTLSNYFTRIIDPILSAIVDEMKRKWLSKKARTQGQSIIYRRDPFKIVTLTTIAEIADKFTRNEILSSNEVRQLVGRTPVDDPRADELSNKNMPADQRGYPEDDEYYDDEEFEEGMDEYDDIDAQLDELESEFEHSDSFDDYLQHYASEYYDPEKAREYNHEYYEQHKKLKGRPQLNEEGRGALRYVKKTLGDERQGKVNEHKVYTNNKINEAREAKNYKYRMAREEMNSNISELREALKNMSKEDRERNKDYVYSLIDELRSENARQRERFSMQYSRLSGQYRSEHASARDALRTEYGKKLEDETEKIYAEPNFIKRKAPKGSRRSSTKANKNLKTDFSWLDKI